MTGSLADILKAALAAQRPEHLQAWSLAVSFLGDCVVPRGGSVGMATITQVLGAYGVDNGVVRTAMSRLASDGWVTREKVGRNAFYALTPAALAKSQAASRRIYADRHPDAACEWRIFLAADCSPEDRKRIRASLTRQGAGSIDQHSFILPAGDGEIDVSPARVLPVAVLAPDAARAMAETAFDLSEIEREYHEFIARFAPALDGLGARPRIAALDALALRVLVIHCFRRIVLRDPGVPSLYLPPDWPGVEARRIATSLWRALSPPTETWLDRHAATANGPLPPRNP